MSELTTTFCDTSSLTATSPQVVKLSTTYAAVTGNFNLGNTWSVNWESPFNANAGSDLTNSVSSTDASAPLLDYDTFEDLDTFVSTFNNTYVNTNSVPGTEFRNVITKLFFSQFLN